MLHVHLSVPAFRDQFPHAMGKALSDTLGYYIRIRYSGACVLVELLCSAHDTAVLVLRAQFPVMRHIRHLLLQQGLLPDFCSILSQVSKHRPVLTWIIRTRTTNCTRAMLRVDSQTQRFSFFSTRMYSNAFCVVTATTKSISIFGRHLSFSETTLPWQRQC